jgi:signal transduction histidine kinase
MSGSDGGLYEEDFVRWTEQQSTALRDAARAGTNLPLDCENLAEEIESLGRSQRHELRTRIAVILEHLLKLEHSPATDPRRGRMETIARERAEIEVLINDSPSLKGDVAQMIAANSPRVVRLTIRVLRLHGEDVGNLAPPMYSEEQVLGDWLPEDSSAPASSP